jgi:uncharacterized protein (TIGR02996 family)
MPVHFVYRCGYHGPTCLYRRRFDDATVLDWWRRHWFDIANEDEASAYTEWIFGTTVASFGDILRSIAEKKTPLPESVEDIANVLQGYCSEVCFEEHCVQAQTNDDQIDMACYFFDDIFLARHGDLAAYILPDDWRLPDGLAEGGWAPAVEEPVEVHTGRDGPGTLYAALLDLHSGEPFCDIDPVDGLSGVRILAGVLVPELCRWLMSLAEPDRKAYGYYLIRLREVLLSEDLAESDEERAFLAAIRDEPADDLNWNAYSDWLLERGERPAGLRLLERALPLLEESEDPGRHQVHVGEHVAQLSEYQGEGFGFNHWFCFDDLWANAHPVLADALLRYATRWDVLSTGNENRWRYPA